MNRSIPLLLVIVLLGACSKNTAVNITPLGAAGESGAAGNSAGGASAGGGGAAAGGPAGPQVPDCTAAKKPAVTEGSGDMAAFGLLGGGCFFVDKTEVTWGAYRKFLDAVKGSEPLQDNKCSWNKNKIDPDAACLTNAVGDGIVVKQEDIYPVTCVDVCDAELFCAWAQKRLCNNDKDAWKNGNDPSHDAWYGACSGGGLRSYPYDQNPAKGVCNDPSRTDMACPPGNKPCSTTPVGALQGCSDLEGRGITDMAGNVSEWTGACDGSIGAGDLCRTAGGSFLTNDAKCSANEEQARDTRRAMIGFRCCADPAP